MIQHISRQVVLLIAAAALVAVAAIGGAAAALNRHDSADGGATVDTVNVSSTSSKKVTDLAYLVECNADNLVQEPSTFTLTCADANSNLEHLTWDGWGAQSATAAGDLALNTCEPSCAAGTVQTYPVTVEVDGLDLGEASAVYTSMKVTFRGAVPSGYDATETLTFAPHSSPVEAAGPVN